MSPAARSLRVFALYLGLTAVTLLLAPNMLLEAFGLPPTSEVWIRVIGMVTAFLGVYYWVAAASEYAPFFVATVLCRLTVPLFFLLFVTAGWVRWPLLLFAAVDAVGAGWTLAALRSSRV